MSRLVEISHSYGDDLDSSSTTLLTVTGDSMTRQLVLRRLLTNPGDYLSHPDYGAGLPGFIGSLFDVQQVQGIIIGQMRMEAGVAQTPPPTVTVTPINNGMTVYLQYTDATTGVPSVLSFNLTE